MELTFNCLKKYDVIRITDGKHMGKVCDMTLLFPENKIKGFLVTGGKGFRFTRQEEFIPVCDVVKIGEDVILIKGNEEPCPPPPKHGNCPPPNNGCPPHMDNRRSFDDYE